MNEYLMLSGLGNVQVPILSLGVLFLATKGQKIRARNPNQEAASRHKDLSNLDSACLFQQERSALNDPPAGTPERPTPVWTKCGGH
jgi:hypothetical protein